MRERQVEQPATQKKKIIARRPEPEIEPEAEPAARRRSDRARRNGADDEEPKPEQRIGANRGAKFRFAEVLAARRGHTARQAEPAAVQRTEVVQQVDLDSLPRGERLALIKAARERRLARDNDDSQQQLEV